MCDGVEDCLHGEDEDTEYCQEHNNRREGRQLFTLEDATNTMHDDNHENTAIIGAVIFCIGILLFTLIIIIQYRRRRRKNNNTMTHSVECQVSAGSSNTYVVQTNSPISSSSPNWSLNTCNVIKDLGKGFFSKVYLVEDSQKNLYAVKTVDKPSNMIAEECIRKEIAILSKLKDHPHIIQMIGFNLTEHIIVLEFCTDGNLKDCVQILRNSVMNVKTQLLIEEISDNDNVNDLLRRKFLYWSYQIAAGMKHLSDLGIIHRDLALRNILLTSDQIIKIADFGLAVSLSDDRKEDSSRPSQYLSRSNKPTPFKWMALESLTSNIFSHKTDIWSFGVTLWELFTLGEEPYGDVNLHVLVKMLQDGDRLPDSHLLSPHNIYLFMKHCWDKEPSNRPTFEDSLNILSVFSNTEELVDMRSVTEPSLDTGYLNMNQERASYWSAYKILHGQPQIAQ